MKTTKLIIMATLMIFGFSGVSLSADLTGTWKVTVTFSDGSLQASNVLIVQNNGSFSYEEFSGKIKKNKYKIPGPFPGRMPIQGVWVQMDRMEFTPDNDNHLKGKLYLSVYDYEASTNKIMGTDAKIEGVRIMDPPPVIKLIGDEEVWIKTGDVYDDLGAKALDGMGKNITPDIVTVSPVDTKTPDTYQVTYNVTAGNGKPASEIVRTVHIMAPAAPSITLKGDEIVNVLKGYAFQDPGSRALNYIHKDISNKVNVLVDGSEGDPNTINTSKSGSVYEITYVVEDENGTAEVKRTVNIIRPEDEKSFFEYCFISNMAGNR